MAEIEADGLRVAVEQEAKRVARELANRWFSRSQEILVRAGDEHEYDLYPIVQSGVPPQWDEAEEAYVFKYPHQAAIYPEFGTEPHEVEADQAQALAFEWPEAPPEIEAMFPETFPTVFFKQVEVEGIPAIKFVRKSRAETKAYAERNL